jgi:periplasmic protein TonB
MLGRAIQHEPEIDLDPTTMGRPKIPGSFLLHIGFIAAIVAGHFVSQHFHGAQWGNQQPPGAIQATLVNAIPLPQDTPPTPNVLATETPSPAPTPPLPNIAPVPPPDAIPIAERKLPPKKEQPKKQQQPTYKHAQPQPQQYRAQYGEAPAPQLARSVAPTNPGPQTPVNVAGGSEGFNYPWYVSLIQSKVAQSWYTQEVDPRTPVGSVTKVTFTIARDGSASNFRISQSSGFPTLDSSALRAVERVENFSPLPSGYSKSSLFVEYTFTYRGAGPVR